jgi:hypothetical protein
MVYSTELSPRLWSSLQFNNQAYDARDQVTGLTSFALDDFPFV